MNAALDSDAFPPGGQTGYREMRTCLLQDASGNRLLTLTFFARAYYVEAELTKKDASGNPGLKAIALGHDTP